MDLSKHLVREGFKEELKMYKLKDHCIFESRNALFVTQCVAQNYDHPLNFKISLENHKRVLCVLSSRLIFLDDIKIIESILFHTRIYNRNSFSLFVSAGMCAVGIFVSLLLFKKEFSNNYPFAVTSCCSLPFIWQTYKRYRDTHENKLTHSFLAFLQQLSINIHKVFQVLKETELISTGKVSSCNLGAAMYLMTFTSSKEMEVVSSWKTLPHLRRFLAGSLLDSIRILSHNNNIVKELLPDWIKCNLATSTLWLEEILHSSKNMKYDNGCISIKDLQQLIDAYLFIQSEFLRWIALCFCCIGGSHSNNLMFYYKLKAKVFKIILNTQIMLAEVSAEVKKQYNLQNIFLAYEHKLKPSEVCKMKNVETLKREVHRIFLLILSTLRTIQGLEDHLENISTTNISDNKYVKEHLVFQLNNVKADLTAVIKSYENICKQFVESPSISTSSNLTTTKTLHSVEVEQKSNDNLKKLNYADSADDIFISKMYLGAEQDSTCKDISFDFDNKPEIPNNLLTELTTTLKPIKTEFKERERLALDRLGLKDIESESDGDDDEISRTDNQKQSEVQITSKYKSVALGDGLVLKYSKQLDKPASKTAFKRVMSDCEDSKSENVQGCSLISFSELAKAIALRADTCNRQPEECYTDD